MNLYLAKDSRYDNMSYRSIGNSGLKLPVISLGFWHNFGSKDVFDTMVAMCHSAFDLGITHFDLANNYGPEYGSAEENLGRIIAESMRPYRDELVISTKAGYDMWLGPYGNGGSKKYLTASLDQSLKRLQLEYVDIYYHHRMDPETPVEESMEALAQAVRSGKALYAGISNYDKENSKKAIEIMKELKCPLIINQRRYSIFDRTIEEDGVKEYAAKAGMGIIAFSPLAQGLLTGKYLTGIPSDSRIARDGRFLKESSLTPERLDQIRKLNEMAAQRGQTLAEMALSWVLKDGDVCSVLIGASKPEQIEENVRIVNNLKFSVDELKMIDSISK